jgi:hypothetical protein
MSYLVEPGYFVEMSHRLPAHESSLHHDPELTMIYTTQRDESFDLERDFSSPERHILQKLFIWKDLAASVEEFRQKKREALLKGWNDSGPVTESRALQSITRDLEDRVALRLRVAVQDRR